MANWFCSVFNVVCVVDVCPRCRSELIDSAWVVIVPGQKCIKEFDELLVKSPVSTSSKVQLVFRCIQNVIHG